MFDLNEWNLVLDVLKPLYKCHKTTVIQEAEKTIERLQKLKEEHNSNENIKKYCDRFILDSLLAAKNYKGYIDLTTLIEDGFPQRYQASVRLELSFIENIPINPIDVLALPQFKKSEYIVDNYDCFKDYFIEVFKSKFPDNDQALAFLYRSGKKNWKHIPFFGGVVFFDEPGLINRRIHIFMLKQRLFENDKNVMADINVLIREAENKLRSSLGLPHVGQGWVRETELFNLVSKVLPDSNIVQHGRPSWLGLQHLDIWIPEHNIAIEYHGKQHFEPVEFFGGNEGFNKTVIRDKRKEMLCKANGTKLLIVKYTDNFTDVITEMKKIIDSRYDI